MGLPLNEVVAFQQVERMRQHALTHAADPPPQLAETICPYLQRQDHHGAPAARNMAEYLTGRACDRHQVAFPQGGGQRRAVGMLARRFYTNNIVRTYLSGCDTLLA